MFKNSVKAAVATMLATAKTFKAKSESPYFITLSEGNKKLVPNKDVRFLIWSIPPIFTCPFATELCKKFCYAMKAYRAYPNARKAWNEHYRLSRKGDFIVRMVYTILAYASKPSYKSAKQIVFRIHESGDFYNKEYAMAWVTIAEIISELEPKVHFMAYTKSIEYFKGVDIPSNMTVRFSLWSDTEPSQKALAEEMGLPVYTAVESFTNEPKKERCECVDCGHCRKCWSAIEMLKCEIH